MLARSTTLFENRCNGIIGSLARFSTMTKSGSVTTEMAKRRSTDGWVQPSRPRSRPIIMQPIIVLRSAAPA